MIRKKYLNLYIKNGKNLLSINNNLIKSLFFFQSQILIFSSLLILNLCVQTIKAQISEDTTTIHEHFIYDTLQTIISDSTRSLDRIIPNEAFNIGEKLSFVIRYGFIHAGHATMEVKEITNIQERQAFRIISTAKSNKTFDIIFKVRDSVQTWIDVEGLFCWKFAKKLREGAYKFDLFVNYDQYAGNAVVEMIRYENNEPLRIRKKEDFVLNIPPYVLDILSSFYYIRSQKLRIGMPIYITNHDNKKVYNLKVYIQRREVVTVKAGKFNTIMVQPVLKGDAIFKQQGKLWVWLTDDEYKIPVQMKSAAFIGKITTELTKIEGTTLPLPSQIE
jgi:hypothetical protein